MSTPRIVSFVTVFAAVATLVGCSSSAEESGSVSSSETTSAVCGDGGADDGPMTFAEYCKGDGWAKYCKAAARQGLYEDVPSCQAQLREQIGDRDGCGPGTTADRALVAAGLIRFDGALARRCRARPEIFEPITTATEPPYDRDCDTKIVEGTGRTGASCANDAVCDSAHYCAGDACPGTCQPRKRAGEAVAVGEKCATGTWPRDGVCERLLDPGESCAPVAPSTKDGICGRGRCGADKICTGILRLGDACDAKVACYAANCVAGRCTRYLSRGDACDIGGDVRCNQNLACAPPPDGNGPATCRPRVARALGETCTWYGIECGDGLVCRVADGRYPDSTEAGRCVPRGGSGSPCRYTPDCTNGFTCSYVSATTRTLACIPRVAVGVACSGDSDDCVESAFCDRVDPSRRETWVCAPKKSFGESCTDSESCPSRMCVKGRCADERGESCRDPRSFPDAGVTSSTAETPEAAPCATTDATRQDAAAPRTDDGGASASPTNDPASTPTGGSEKERAGSGDSPNDEAATGQTSASSSSSVGEGSKGGCSTTSGRTSGDVGGVLGLALAFAAVRRRRNGTVVRPSGALSPLGAISPLGAFSPLGAARRPSR